jgi:cobalamin biosynthesis Mg chelatase CobN
VCARSKANKQEASRWRANEARKRIGGAIGKRKGSGMQDAKGKCKRQGAIVPPDLLGAMSSRRSLASFALSRPKCELVALFFWVRPRVGRASRVSRVGAYRVAWDDTSRASSSSSSSSASSASSASLSAQQQQQQQLQHNNSSSSSIPISFSISSILLIVVMMGQGVAWG